MFKKKKRRFISFKDKFIMLRLKKIYSYKLEKVNKILLLKNNIVILNLKI